MLFSTIFASSALVATALSETITVSVGKKGDASNIEFTPSSIKAAEGDIISFKFWPKNHSVVQAGFQKPCEPLDGGFWSGFVATQDLETASPTKFEYTVTNASAPIWFYCSQAKHCQNGMVGVINENTASGNTLQKFTEAAAKVDASVSPTTSPSNTTSSPSGTASESPSGTGSASTGTSTPGAASGLTINSNLAVTGVLGMFAYFLL